ncbi:protein S100-P isoform X1 [Rissa tridactyla]|uniref:protein S100-P isoform X1 n=1 Tax=Rissa tridactyla TaxID=75485 RepID=UPI0023BB1000|nr:protein S100-P isoform X1 [Rissa tridactyla]XP_054059087.1 protein S100-P isoform X1 [Rissa tridactyla]XP_054059089.1 protein S100-P isoform X1 [Rissa tridactyla]
MIIISLKLLLTMCFGSLATGPNNVTVTQTPTKIHLSVGEYAEISCVWDKSACLRYRVSWYLVNRENITKTVSSKLCYVSSGTFECEDVLVIKSATVNDAGFYYCEIIIEIPFCKKVFGNGTTLIVEEKEAHSLKKRDLAIWAVIPFLVAVGSLYLCYRKKQCSKHSGSAQLPVPAGRRQEEQMLKIVELHGRNEPTKEASEENSSCNSVEWAVSTLYESLDSFLNESRGKDDKSTATIVSNAAYEQIPQTRAAEKV